MVKNLDMDSTRKDLLTYKDSFKATIQVPIAEKIHLVQKFSNTYSNLFGLYLQPVPKKILIIEGRTLGIWVKTLQLQKIYALCCTRITPTF